MSPVRIRAIHDFVCAWCRVAEAGPRAALATSATGSSVVIAYRPFELHLSLPVAGVDRAAYRERQYGSVVHASAMRRRR